MSETFARLILDERQRHAAAMDNIHELREVCYVVDAFRTALAQATGRSNPTMLVLEDHQVLEILPELEDNDDSSSIYNRCVAPLHRSDSARFLYNYFDEEAERITYAFGIGNNCLLITLPGLPHVDLPWLDSPKPLG